MLGTFFYLYPVTDIFSRRIVAARVYGAENDEYAAALFAEVREREQLAPGETTLHSDNGPAMKGATLKAKPVGNANCCVAVKSPAAKLGSAIHSDVAGSETARPLP